MDAASMPSSTQLPAKALSTISPCSVLAVRCWCMALSVARPELDLKSTTAWRRNSIAVRQFTIHTWDHLVEERRAGMRALIDMLAAGKLHPRIHAKVPLAEASAGARDARRRRGARQAVAGAVTTICPIRLRQKTHAIPDRFPPALPRTDNVRTAAPWRRGCRRRSAARFPRAPASNCGRRRRSRPTE